MLIFILLFSIVLHQSSSFRPSQMKYHPHSNSDNVGYPSFVTPFIEKGQIEEGQKNCTVQPLKAKIKSYAGFITVNKQFQSNMYFWYFPAENQPETAPVVLWLQGGPGVSSLYGLFEEIGPFSVKKSHGLKSRKYYWSKSFHVIFIDNPVGAGFSFTTSDNGYAKTEVDVANDLYTALLQFFTLFPNLQKNDFFVSGESYAGKYVPSLANKIDKANSDSKQLKINLKGITIGNGLCDPQNMLQYGDYLYQIGLIDDIGLNAFKQKENEIVNYIKNNQFDQAYASFDSIIGGDSTPQNQTLFYQYTQFENYFDYREAIERDPFGDFDKYIQSDLARRFIHVGNYPFYSVNLKVESYLKTDVMKSVKPLVENLLSKYRVLIYNGQFDIIVAYPLTRNFLKNLNWAGAVQFKLAKRYPLRFGNDIAGYFKSARNLVEVLIRNAGHMVPKDQPIWALNLISRFMFNKPLSD